MTEADDTKFNAGGAASPGAGRGDESAAPDSGAADGALAAAAGDDAPPLPQEVAPLVLQPDFRAGGKSQYHVAELLAFHDRHFVEGVYRAILGRAPFPAEGERELDELRGGRAGKVEIIERLLASPEARRGVRVAGLPSPLMRRLGQVPFIGYWLRLARALARLPVSMRHQRQFEIYALAQQQLIADYLNRTLPHLAHRDAAAATAGAVAPEPPVAPPSPPAEIVEALEMFSDALLELSNSHAELEARTEALREQTRTQVEQAQEALNELTAALSAQQQLAETFRREQQLAADTLQREQQLTADRLQQAQQLAADTLQQAQQLAADAQQEFLIQEQHVIVEAQQVVAEELRDELRALSQRQQKAREAFDAEVRRLRSLQEAAAAGENFSGQA